jgi:hypothetical protein
LIKKSFENRKNILLLCRLVVVPIAIGSGGLENLSHFILSSGEMAEWSIAAVLKTVELRGSGGSNPSLSANFENIFADIFSKKFFYQCMVKYHLT